MKTILSCDPSRRARVIACVALLGFALACGGSSSSSTTPGGGCQIITGMTTTAFPAAGGTADISVTTASTCPWTAVSNSAFLTVTQGSSGMGTGSVRFTVSANTGAARSAILTITGTAITITQSAP